MKELLNSVKSELQDCKYNMFYSVKGSGNGDKSYHLFCGNEFNPFIDSLYCDDNDGGFLFVGFYIDGLYNYRLDYSINNDTLKSISQDIFIELVTLYYNAISSRINDINYKMDVEVIVDGIALMIKVPIFKLDSIIENVIRKYNLYKVGNLISNNPTMSKISDIECQNKILNMVTHGKIINIVVTNNGMKTSVNIPILTIITSKGTLEFYPTDTCCGRTYLEDGQEELKSMINEQILSISATSNRDIAIGTKFEWDVYTFYKIETLNHSCTLRFYEGSNYAEYVNVKYTN